MEIGVVGLGKMGMNLSLNLVDQGNTVYGFDINSDAVNDANHLGVKSTDNLDTFLSFLSDKKTLWVMVPSGDPTENIINSLFEKLSPGDTIIEAGNSNFNDTVRRAKKAKELKIDFLDAGTSGGTAGARNGACIMVGGSKEVFDRYENVLKNISVQDGCMYAGESGSGHFLKMVHNGIEYGMMQAIAEGFEILEESNYNYDLANVALLFDNGSVIRGWLMELMVDALAKDGNLSAYKGVASASGEAKWAVETALEMEVPVPVMALSLMMRNRSLKEDTFSMKVISALRNGFGGHPFIGTDGNINE